METLSAIFNVTSKFCDFKEKFAAQIIDCVKNQKTAEDWLLNRLLRDISGKDILKELLTVGLHAVFSSIEFCDLSPLKYQKLLCIMLLILNNSIYIFCQWELISDGNPKELEIKISKIFLPNFV